MGERAFQIQLQDDVLAVTVAGARPQDDGEYFHAAMGTWSRIAQLSERHRARGVLVVLHLSGESSSVRSRSIAQALDQINLSRDRRVAVVNPDTRSRPHTEFAVKLANARGWNARVFASEPQARDWLSAAAQPA